MSLITFVPIVAPSPGTQHVPEINIRQAEFGDGYTQAAPSGLNHVRQVVTLKWDSLAPSEVASIQSFLVERAGYKPFLYQPYGFTAPVRWTCAEWNSTASAPWTLTAKLRQNFTLQV